MSGYTAHELKALEHDPAALEAAADYNDCREAEADAQDWSECAVFHRNRAHELRVQATVERARIDKGLPPADTGVDANAGK